MRSLARLFALAPDCHAGNSRYARLWRRHFYEGLAMAMPDVVLATDVDFGWARPASRATVGASPQRTAMSERLWEQIRAAPIDAVISYCFASDIDPSLVTATVASGRPWINFFCDSTYAFDRVEPIAREASLNWFPESAAEWRYRALGRPWLCRPYALNPTALPESPCEVAVHPLGFVGAPTGNRILRLAALAALGCRVAIRGEGWHDRLLARALRPLLRAGGGLDHAGLARFVSECRLILGLNEGGAQRRSERSYLKLRDVEFPGYGACYLTQHNRDVERAFDVGREVLAFRGLAEAAAIARDYAARPELAQAVGRAGRRRVLGEHTWSTRLAEIAQAL